MGNIGVIDCHCLLITGPIGVRIDFALLMQAHLRSVWNELQSLVVACIIEEVVRRLTLRSTLDFCQCVITVML